MAKLTNISHRDEKMLQTLICQRFAVQGKDNFTNMSRYLDANEQTLRVWFDRDVDWRAINGALCELAMSQPPRFAGLDCSFVSKAGDQTYGLAKFWDGSQSKAHKGLEICCLALFDPETGEAYTLDVRQTPAGISDKKLDDPGQYTRMDFYLEALEALPASVTHVAADSFFAKNKAFQAVEKLGKRLVTKLRSDANLRYLATEAEKEACRKENKRGRNLKYAGKADWQNLDEERWQTLQSPEGQGHLKIRTAILNSPNLERNLRVVYVVDTRNGNDWRIASDDLETDPLEIKKIYEGRFQMEYIFRDAKQHSGLTDEQTRKQQRLDFHFNLSLTALNFAKAEMKIYQTTRSVADYARLVKNEWTLNLFKSNFDLNAEFGLNEKTQQKIREIGFIHKSRNIFSP
ncbi:MAG: transposase [Cyclobacteriaceae bacterium]|nr:transposase [Cyclobacteriaceae bacterium]